MARHVSGVEQALSELNEGLEVLSDNQSERVDRLVDDVTRLERLYTAATKTSKYVSDIYICTAIRYDTEIALENFQRPAGLVYHIGTKN